MACMFRYLAVTVTDQHYIYGSIKSKEKASITYVNNTHILIFMAYLFLNIFFSIVYVKLDVLILNAFALCP